MTILSESWHHWLDFSWFLSPALLTTPVIWAASLEGQKLLNCLALLCLKHASLDTRESPLNVLSILQLLPSASSSALLFQWVLIKQLLCAHMDCIIQTGMCPSHKKNSLRGENLHHLPSQKEALSHLYLLALLVGHFPSHHPGLGAASSAPFALLPTPRLPSPPPHLYTGTCMAYLSSHCVDRCLCESLVNVCLRPWHFNLVGKPLGPSSVSTTGGQSTNTVMKN